jgi:pilus assembly protein CpaE
MLSARADVDDKVSGLQAGADDYVQKPVAPKELVARVESLLQRMKRVQPPKGQIIAVVGAKGGVGVTTVAVNVAITLASKDHPTILVELRNVHGTVATKFQMSPSQDLGGLLSLPPEQIDRSDVIRRLVRHSSGLRLLIAPQRATDELLTAAHVESIVELLSIETAYLILDLPYVGSKAAREALERSDQILLVTEPEMLSIACTRGDLETLDTWGLRDRINLVVNTRSRSNTSITPSEIEEKLGLPLIATIPPAPEVFQVAAGMGKPIVISRPEELAASTLIKLTNQLEAAGN